MPQKCIPGVICIENMTFFMLLISLGVVIYIYTSIYSGSLTQKSAVVGGGQMSMVPEHHHHYSNQNMFTGKLNSIYSNHPKDVLLNPYAGPLRDERPHVSGDVRGDIPVVPINVRTQGYVDSEYRQMGFLKKNVDGEEVIVPLMGRPLIANRDKWQYYTINDKNNSIKLPIIHRGKRCMGEYGCDSISNGDDVQVEGYNNTFKTTLYDNNTMTYIPVV